MKKRFFTLILTLTAMLMCIFGLTACGDKEVSFKLNFVVDNEIYATIDTSGDEVIALPENPTKETHTFDGWFWDKDVWNKPFTANSLLDAPLSSEMSVYAKFILNTIDGVTFEDVETTYDGTEKTLAVSNLPNDASVTYDKANTYTNAGEYTVTATIIQENHEDLQLTATLTINKATYDMSGISFVGDMVTYDGNVHSLAITGTLPNGVTVSYENNDKTNADTYTVIAKFTDTTGNYENPENKTATLTINKATYNMDGVVFADKTVTYNGNACSIEAQNVPSGLSVSYTDNDKTNADTYTVTAIFTDTTGNYVNPENMTAQLVINKATITGVTFADKTFTYDTKTHTLAITGNLPACVNVTYANNDKVNANTYTVTASFEDTSGNYIVPNDMSAKLIINKATVSGITFENKTFTYNGTKRSLEISGTLPEEVTVSYVNNGKTNTNTYNVTATFACETENYVVPEDMTAVLTIKKAMYDMSAVTFENKTVTYDGKVHSLAVSDNLPDGVTVTYENNDKISANQYIVTAIFTGDSINYYSIDDMQAILTINKATYDMNKVQFVGGRFTYDGTPKSIYVTGNLPDGVIVNYTNNGKINANTYTVTATFTGDTQNYNKLPDWTASLIIDKATYDMSGVSFKNQTFTYDTTAKNALITGTLPNGVEASYVGNGKTDVGTYSVTAKFNGDSNNYHLIEDMTVTLKINQAVPYIKEVSCNQSLNLYSAVELIADTEVAGTIALDNGQTLTLGYKTYSWTFVPEDTHNYTNATGTVGLTVCALVSYYNDSVLFSSQNIVLNNSATVPTVTPLRADANGYSYTFSHWAIEENGAEYNFTNAIMSDLNLYAVYDSEEIVYAINYYDTKGVEHDNITTYTVSTEYTLLNIEKEHYVFNGWTDKNGNKVTKINKGTFGALDLHATWTPIEYAITYDLGYRGAVNGNNPTTYNVENSFSFVNATYDEYHTFAGWYLEENYVNEKPCIFSGESGEITLYAKWNFSGTYISTVSELQNVAYNMSGAYELKNDINLQDFNWTSIGSEEYPFNGYFNGAGHHISNTVDTIFIVNNGEILDLTLLYVNISCDKDVGAIASVNNGSISNCIVSGSINSKNNHVGGITGKNNGSISYCESYCNISVSSRISTSANAEIYVGGISGLNKGTINFCLARNTIESRGSAPDYLSVSSYVGGICGSSSGAINACSFVGELYNSCDNGDIGSRAYIGGIAGLSSTNITNCYSCLNSAEVSAYSMCLAGIVGDIGYQNNIKTLLSNCYSIMENISYNWKKPSADYTGDPIELAGIAGRASYSEIQNCMCINRVIVDYTFGNYVITNSYNKETTFYLTSTDYVENILNWKAYINIENVDDGNVWILVDGELPKLFFE